MKILVSGSTGLIGSALVPVFAAQSHDVTALVRSAPRAGQIRWDPIGGKIDGDLSGFDAIVHLAGENVGAKRWTAAQKALIRDSRINGTRLLAESIAKLSQPPSVFVSASALGYYGDRGDELLSEDSPPGAGFLADVCKEWEAALAPLDRTAVRVIKLRIGVVLSTDHGALAQMLPIFRIGAGGVIGSGRQYISWIAIDDIVGAIQHALATPSLSGPVNLVAPNPVTNREFTKTLGRVLSRPTILPVPAFALRIGFGELADELLLAGARVQPRQLVAAGYQFRHPQLDGCLRALLNRP